MFKDSISLENILEIFLAGGVVVLGIWYLHRPFLTVYFPTIASDVASLDMGNKLGGKVIIFLIISLFIGSIITHAFDGLVPLIIVRNKYNNIFKRILYSLFRLFIIIRVPDPRLLAIDRYLESERKSWFLEVAKDWAHTSESKLNDADEKIRVHQHLVTRLRTFSSESRSVLDGYYTNLSFSGSLFIAVLMLVPISILSFFTQMIIPKTIGYTNTQLLWFIVIIYAFQFLCGFLFKRRLRTFYNQAITLALHFHDCTKSKTISN
jgi:hypothetical protein